MMKPGKVSEISPQCPQETICKEPARMKSDMMDETL